MQLALPIWFEIGTYVVLLLILGFDLFLAFKRPHVPSSRESALWIGFYVVLALLFAGTPSTRASSWPDGSPNTACRSTTCSCSC